MGVERDWESGGWGGVRVCEIVWVCVWRGMGGCACVHAEEGEE